MKITCLQSNLSKSLKTAERGVGTRSTFHAATCILMEAQDGQLTLKSTNLELAIVIQVGCKVEEEGAVAIPAKLLVSTVASMPDDTMTLIATKSALTITCGGAEARISGMEATAFPPIPQVSGQATVLQATDLAKSLKRVVFAAATDYARPVLTAVCFDYQPDGLYLVAADGFRLARQITGEPSEVFATALVPATSATELLRVLPDEGQVTVTLSKATARFEVGNTQLVTQLIQGTYPTYDRTIPQEFTGSVTVNRAALLQAVRTAAIYAANGSGIVRLRAPDKHTPKLRVAAIAQEQGDVDTPVDCQVEGEVCNWACNCAYMQDLLGALDEDMVRIQCNTPSSPFVITAVGNDKYLHVIMPMFVQW